MWIKGNTECQECRSTELGEGRNCETGKYLLPKGDPEALITLLWGGFSSTCTHSINYFTNGKAGLGEGQGHMWVSAGHQQILP